MLDQSKGTPMATKKIWSVYEVGATYEGPLGKVEASSESSALASAAAFYGVPRKKLYALPEAALEGALAGRRSHATIKSASEGIVAQMIGRHVKSGWHGLIDGVILQWEPFGAGTTDVLVRDVASGKLSWYASHGLTPIDGQGPLPSRTEVRKLREAEMKVSLGKIAERWAKEPPRPRLGDPLGTRIQRTRR
jgi:hypothetical protein